MPRSTVDGSAALRYRHGMGRPAHHRSCPEREALRQRFVEGGADQDALRGRLADIDAEGTVHTVYIRKGGRWLSIGRTCLTCGTLWTTGQIEGWMMVRPNVPPWERW